MKFVSPITDKKIDDLFALTTNGKGGFYPIGLNNAWHGGVHIEGNFAIQAVADGQIIGYRLTKAYCTVTINGKEYSYSNSFVLIEHHYESPNGQKLTFYSHYNHLLPFDEYDAAQKSKKLAITNPQFDTVVTDPIAVKAGDLIGFSGIFEGEVSPEKYSIVHFEVFSSDDIAKLVTNPKKDGKDHPDTLKIEKDAVLKKAEKKYPDLALIKGRTIKATVIATVNDQNDKDYIKITEKALIRKVNREFIDYHDNPGTTNDYYTVKHDKRQIVSTIFDGIEVTDTTQLHLIQKAGNDRILKLIVPNDYGTEYWVKRSSAGSIKNNGVEIKTDIAETYKANPNAKIFDTDAGTVTDDTVCDLSKCDTFNNGTDTWYKVKCGTVEGWIKDSDPKLKKLSAYDWPGFTIIEESGDSQYDPVIDFDNISPFFKKIIDQINTDSDSSTISQKELQDAIKKPEIADKLNHLICKNPSEWWTDDQMGPWQRILGLLNDERKTALQQQIKDLCWWDKVAIKAEDYPLSPTVYHWHPVAFLDQMERMQCNFITLEQAKEIAIRVTGGYEGRDPSYSTITGNFDNMGISWGLIQWNFGQNTLGPLLLKMKNKNSTQFKKCFNNNDDDYNEFSKVISEYTSTKQVEWAKKTHKIQNKKITWNGNWKSYFDALANVLDFQEVQKEEALGDYHKGAIKVINWCKNVLPDHFKLVTLRMYVSLYDMSVQQGTGGLSANEKEELIQKWKDKRPQDAIAATTDIVTLNGSHSSGSDASKVKGVFRADCISRRLGILSAQPTEVNFKDDSGKNHISKRQNNNFGLVKINKAISELS